MRGWRLEGGMGCLWRGEAGSRDRHIGRVGAGRGWRCPARCCARALNCLSTEWKSGPQCLEGPESWGSLQMSSAAPSAVRPWDWRHTAATLGSHSCGVSQAPLLQGTQALNPSTPELGAQALPGPGRCWPFGSAHFKKALGWK